jgi:leucyl-tRNA---protein transferase
MTRVLDVLLDPPHPCGYLPQQTAQLQHRIQLDVSPAELDTLLAAGVRRFGPDYFAPQCPTCSACTPTRVATNRFVASKSQRRVLRENADLTLSIAAPSIDTHRLALYADWHGEREQKRGWAGSTLSADHYALQFAFPHPCARELSMRTQNGDLIGVSIVDETPTALSAVYFFSATAERARSLGVFNVLALLDIAAKLGKAHLYLGFLVEGCASLAYKANYNPQERLLPIAGSNLIREWQRVDKTSNVARPVAHGQ